MKKLSSLFLLLVACSVNPPNYPDPYKDLKFDATIQNGLNNQEREAYYHFDYGIQWLPTNVFLTLNRPQTSVGLYDEQLLERPERFGMYRDPFNNKLPIGITESNDPNYVGMSGINCSQCHTSYISHNGKSFIIDGGSSLFAIDRFIKEMLESLIFTVINPVEYVKFYDRYKQLIKLEEDQNNKDALNEFLSSKNYADFKLAGEQHIKGQNKKFDNDLNSISDHLITLKADKYCSINTTLDNVYPTNSQLNSGLGMFSYLSKRILFFYNQATFANNNTNGNNTDSGLSRSNPWSVGKNLFSAHLMNREQKDWLTLQNAPVNTPAIFNYNESKWIFYGANTNSMVERNQIQGITLLTDFNWYTLETTISIKKLDQISAYTTKIKPPMYPEQILGAINKSNAELGKQIFKDNCLGCHSIDKPNGTASISYKYIDVGTDNNYVNGQMESFYGFNFFTDAIAPFLKQVKFSSYKREGILGNENYYEYNRQNVIWKQPAGNDFPARPLYGVWATSPLLHNASIQNITELLKKPTERTKSFNIGNTEFDTVNLGFNNTPLYFSFNLQTDCPSCIGNSSEGHSFGTNLTQPQKEQLIEFLKSYTEETQF